MAQDSRRLLLRRRHANSIRWSSIHNWLGGWLIEQKLCIQVFYCWGGILVQMVESSKWDSKRKDENSLQEWTDWVLERRLVHVWLSYTILWGYYWPDDHRTQMVKGHIWCNPNQRMAHWSIRPPGVISFNVQPNGHASFLLCQNWLPRQEQPTGQETNVNDLASTTIQRRLIKLHFHSCQLLPLQRSTRVLFWREMHGWTNQRRFHFRGLQLGC